MLFDELVKRYYENNQQKKKYTDLVAADNNEIKSRMLAQGDEVVETDAFKVSCKTIETEDFDQAKLLDKIKKLWQAQNGDVECPWIQRVEVVDMEAVTNAIYDGMIVADELNDCKTKKTQVRLTVNPLK
jgi:hypothetical protein